MRVVTFGGGGCYFRGVVTFGGSSLSGYRHSRNSTMSLLLILMLLLLLLLSLVLFIGNYITGKDQVDEDKEHFLHLYPYVCDRPVCPLQFFKTALGTVSIKSLVTRITSVVLYLVNIHCNPKFVVYGVSAVG